MAFYDCRLALLARQLTQSEYNTYHGRWEGTPFSPGDYIFLNGLRPNVPVKKAVFEANYSRGRYQYDYGGVTQYRCIVPVEIVFIGYKNTCWVTMPGLAPIYTNMKQDVSFFSAFTLIP